MTTTFIISYAILLVCFALVSFWLWKSHKMIRELQDKLMEAKNDNMEKTLSIINLREQIDELETCKGQEIEPEPISFFELEFIVSTAMQEKGFNDLSAHGKLKKLQHTRLQFFGKRYVPEDWEEALASYTSRMKTLDKQIAKPR